jgi:oxygen-independent coproporphyrinogen-3 oxidase
MKLILKGHDFEYEIKMLLNLYFPNEKYEIVDEIIDKDNTIESIITNNYYKVSYYEEGVCKFTSSLNKSDIEKLPTEPIERRRESKKIIKKLVNNVAYEITNKKQPWGILTGIRPTKIVFDLIDKYGWDKEKIKLILREKYQICEEKINLMMEIVENEINILKTNTNNEMNIYIGIPFCPTKCLYCSFTSYPIDKWKDHVNDYLNALSTEMEYVSKKLLVNKKVKTIYVGGGTPTSLNAEQLEFLMTMINKNFDVNNIEEFTVEAGRPDTINIDKLKVLKRYGVSRISINPQTMNDKTLQIIGRRHSVEDVYYAYNMAREVGFNNINMDIILGLPGESFIDVKHTLDEIKNLKPESLTVHTMAVKRASKLKRTVEMYHLVESKEIDHMIKMVYHEAKSIGLKPYYMYRQKNMVGNYENVGYSIQGKECIYNVIIIEEAQTILALGAGAVSKIVFPKENRIERIENVKDVHNYINRIDEMIDRKRKFFHP